MISNPKSSTLCVTHLIDFVPDKHFYNVIACCVGFQFVQPVFKLCESVALCDVIHCQIHANGEEEEIF